jgi:23S rRNA (guanine745-N1)-methyltransferase
MNLAPGHNQQAEKYDAALFESRRLVLERGFYEGVLGAIEGTISGSRTQGCAFTLLDAGCGEGFYARKLARRFPAAQVLGLDLSRDAISAAVREGRAAGTRVHWLVGNLARLPMADHSVDVLLNILTPADYAEFGRVLAPSGFLVKVVPGPRYLEQVRSGVAEHLRRGAYSNERVLEHLQAHGRILERCSVLRTFPVNAQEAAAFVAMTPMTFGLGEEALGDVSFSEITIDLEVVRVGME